MKRKPLILLGIFAVLAAALLGGWAWVHFSAAKGIDFGEAEIAELVVYQGNEEVARVTDRGKIESFVQLFSDKICGMTCCASPGRRQRKTGRRPAGTDASR